jgi:SAM-dependent methyltransferase
VTTRARFDELVAAAEAEPTEGWDFSWFEGRATEERPSWGYARCLVGRVARVDSVLDVQTGGGEVFADVLGQAKVPDCVRATESWPPNLAVARRNLAPVGGVVVDVADDAPLPFDDGTFDLVTSRHPTIVVWPEIARVLRRGATYFSQQVGSGSNRELTDFMMGPQPVSDARSPRRAASQAQSAGLEVLDLRHESLEVRFFDVGAVVYFLRKVVWTVPGFTVDSYRDRLVAMHEHIQRHGSFMSHAQRFLIEARTR